MTLEAFNRAVVDHDLAEAGELPRRVRPVRARAGGLLRPDGYRPADARPGIVRNLAKIDAAIANARVIAAWVRALRISSGVTRSPSINARSGWRRCQQFGGLSGCCLNSLKKQGIRFLGPTTAYATMQAVGWWTTTLWTVGLVPRLTPGPSDTE